MVWSQGWLTAGLGKLTLSTLGFLSVSGSWKDESSGIYDAMLKSETSLVTHKISFVTSSLQQAQPIWQVWLGYLKGCSEFFLRRTRYVKIVSHKSWWLRLRMVYACVKQTKQKTLIVECLFFLWYLPIFSVSHFAASKPMWVYFVEIKYQNWSKQYN